MPVFRDDRYQLLDEPAHVLLITAAAPNRQALLRNQPELADSVSTVLSGRAARVLGRVAAFDHVVFAILDRTPDSPTRRAFADRLAPMIKASFK